MNKNLPAIDDEHVLTDLEALRILSDSLRLQLLEHIRVINDRGQAAAVKQLAEALSMPATKLYYHINLLEEHGLIRVVETQLVSGILEKRYQVRARRFRAELDLAGEGSATGEDALELLLSSLGAVLDKTLAGVEQSFRYLLRSAGRKQVERALAGSEMDIVHTTLTLDSERALEFRQKLQALVNAYMAQADESAGNHYKLTIVFNPAYHLKATPEDPGHGVTIL